MRMKKLKKPIALLLSLLLVISGCVVSASAAVEETKVVLTLGDLLKYQDGIEWYTHEMFADGEMAYCVNPRLPAPEGTFRISDDNCIELTSNTHSNYTKLYKALYYCYGGDGFNTKLDYVGGKTMKQYMDSLGEAGWLTAKGNDLYYLLTHRVLAKIYGDSDWAYGLTSDWRDAVNKVYNLVWYGVPNISITMNLYILDTGNSKYQKVILSKDRIKLQLQKNSANEELTANNPCYSLEGAVYDIYLDESCKEYFGSITTDENGFGAYGGGSNGTNVPLQKYYAKERTAPEGYALDPTVYEFKDSGKKSNGISIYSITCEDNPQNDPVAILLKKIDKDGQGLPGAEFTISYYKGHYDTQAELSGVKPTRSWVFKTNENGYIFFDSNYFVSGDEFYYTETNPNPILPLGTIVIQETKAPDGYEIDPDNNYFIRKITSDSSGESVFTYNAPEITNEEALNPSIVTSARDYDFNSGYAYVYPYSYIVDTVSYSGLIAGHEFTLKGKLMDKATGKALLIDGEEITAEKTFTPSSPNGSIEMEFELDSTSLAGKSVVVFEDLYYEGNVVATHSDINDLNQTITYKNPEITTLARVDYTDSRYGYIDEITGMVEFTDTVSYSDLIAGVKYTLTGVVMDKETGKELIVDGQSVTVEKTFVPAANSGTVDMTFNFDGLGMNGKSVVVYEYLSYVWDTGVKEEIASHCDINDENQTITIQDPKISTSAADKVSGTNEAHTSSGTEIVDTVSYSGLIPGLTYSVYGNLIDKETGKNLVVDGETVTGETTFTPESESGTVDVIYTFDSSGLEGKSFVVYEYLDLLFDNKFLAVTSHTDINDEGQTITFKNPTVKTTATDKETGNHEGYAGESTTIVDKVELSGLIVGESYTVDGVLMDKSTGAELLIDGNTVTASKTFEATAESMTVEMEFTFNSSDLHDADVVVFEDLKYKGSTIANHRDIDDMEQTVTIIGYGEIRFVKTDENGSPLSNVRFTLFADEDCTERVYDVDGNLVNTKSSDNNGLVEFTRIKFGTYYIAETKAQSGTQLLAASIKAVVSADGTKLYFNEIEITSSAEAIVGGEAVQLTSVSNSKTPEFPRAGSSERALWLTVGLALIGFGLTYFATSKFKKKKGNV